MMGQCCELCGRLAVYWDPFPRCAPCYTPAPVTVPTVGEMLSPLPAFGWLAVTNPAGMPERNDDQTGES